MSSESGKQGAADYNARQWENSEFPKCCNTCLGDGQFVRMMKQPLGDACKMCTRPMTIFKWRPNRHGGYRVTAVCQTCANLKNICQVCLLDLQFGLPSMIRDAVLAEMEGTTISSDMSDVNREYQQQQQLMALENGEDMWASRNNPNERLLAMARTVMKDRTQTRIVLPTTTATTEEKEKDSKKRGHQDAFVEGNETTSQTQPQHQQQQQQQQVAAAEAVTVAVTKAVLVKPPKPAGPPPPSAFKNKPTTAATTTAATTTTTTA